MAAVFAGMTLLQLMQLAVALATLGLDAPKLVQLLEDLKAKGHPEDSRIPPEHLEALKDALCSIKPSQDDSAAQSFIDNTLGR
jgi:hypothetical protein